MEKEEQVFFKRPYHAPLDGHTSRSIWAAQVGISGFNKQGHKVGYTGEWGLSEETGRLADVI